MSLLFIVGAQSHRFRFSNSYVQSSATHIEWHAQLGLESLRGTEGSRRENYRTTLRECIHVRLRGRTVTGRHQSILIFLFNLDNGKLTNSFEPSMIRPGLVTPDCLLPSPLTSSGLMHHMCAVMRRPAIFIIMIDDWNRNTQSNYYLIRFKIAKQIVSPLSSPALLSTSTNLLYQFIATQIHQQTTFFFLWFSIDPLTMEVAWAAFNIVKSNITRSTVQCIKLSLLLKNDKTRLQTMLHCDLYNPVWSPFTRFPVL